MRYYELTCLISPELSQEELNSFQEKIISLVQEEKGILGKITSKRNLALPIRKKGGATLVTLDFQLDTENLENLGKKLKADNQIIHYLLLVKKLPKAGEITEKPPRFPKKIVKPKVELKEIEKKLEEILGE